jgi:PST family polysaccharide transporter
MLKKIKHAVDGLMQRPNLMAAMQNLGWLAFDRVFRLGVSFVVTLWLARYLAPELFGVYNYAIAFTALFSVAATAGLQSVVVQNLVDEPDQRSATLASSFVIQLVGGVVAFVAAIFTAYLLNSDESIVLISVVLLSSMNLFRFADTVRYYFESRVQSKLIVVTENLVFLLIVALRVLMISLESPLLYFIALLVLEAVLTAAAFLYLFGKQKVGRLHVDKTNLLRLLGTAWPLTFSLVAAMVYQRIDQIMLASLVDQKAVGIYSAAVRISELWYVFPLIVVGSFFPRILKEIREAPERANRQIDLLLTSFAVAAMVVGFVVTVYANFIVVALFGMAYENSATVLIIHIWSSLFVFSGALSSRWLIAMSLQKYLLISTLAGAVINIALNYILIPVSGAVGAAWATLIAQSFSLVLVNCFHPVARKMFVMQISALSLFSVRRLFRWWRLNV